MRASRTIAIATLLSALVGSSCSTTPPAATTPPVPTAAEGAAALCPLMWTWVKDVGEAFNTAAADVAGIELPEDRRQRWHRALDEVDTLNQALLTDLEPLGNNPVIGTLVADVVRDLPLAEAELEDIRRLLIDNPEVDEERHQVRTSQIIVRIEKVIDLPKPDIGDHDPDGRLLEAFRGEPSCQHAIRGVDDGTARANN